MSAAGPLSAPAMTPLQVEAAAVEFEGRSPEALLRWASGRFPGRLTFATGFGVEGCVLIDVIGRHGLAVDVFTLDTGLLFPETYDLWRRLEARYGITIRGVKPAHDIEEQAAHHGPELWTRAPDRCCELRKMVPLREELGRFDAWVTAIRRDQTAERAGAKAVEEDRKFSLVKINPLLTWTEKDVWRYVVDHGVPYNLLHDQGYPSIGCAPCTSPVKPGEDPRAGRWRGRGKTECGLHVTPEAGNSR